MAIGTQDDLAVVRFELSDRVEKFLLNHAFAVKEIDVVDHEDVDAAKPLPKAGKRPVSQRLSEMVRETLRRKKHHAQLGMTRPQPPVRRLQQMGLSRPHAAVKHERIVTGPGLLTDLQGGREGQLIARPLDEIRQVGEATARRLRGAGRLWGNGPRNRLRRVRRLSRRRRGAHVAPQHGSDRAPFENRAHAHRDRGSRSGLVATRRVRFVSGGRRFGLGGFFNQAKRRRRNLGGCVDLHDCGRPRLEPDLRRFPQHATRRLRDGRAKAMLHPGQQKRILDPDRHLIVGDFDRGRFLRTNARKSAIRQAL